MRKAVHHEPGEDRHEDNHAEDHGEQREVFDASIAQGRLLVQCAVLPPINRLVDNRDIDRSDEADHGASFRPHPGISHGAAIGQIPDED